MLSVSEAFGRWARCSSVHPKYLEQFTMQDTTKTKICSICGASYDGFGNNAEPINAGRCCDSCDQIVIVRRINDLRRNTTKYNAKHK